MATNLSFFYKTACQPVSETVKYASAAGDAKRYQR